MQDCKKSVFCWIVKSHKIVSNSGFSLIIEMDIENPYIINFHNLEI